MKTRLFSLILGFAAVGAALLPADEPAPVPTVITSQADDAKTVGDETTILFTGLVTVTGTDLKLTCDRLEVLLAQAPDSKKKVAGPTVLGESGKFKHLLATGRVKIVQGDRIATCGRAEVLPDKDQVILTEKPMVEDPEYGTATAHLIRMQRGERHVFLEGGPDGAPQIVTRPIKDLGFGKDQPAPKKDVTPGAPPRIQLNDPTAPATPADPAKTP